MEIVTSSNTDISKIEVSENSDKTNVINDKQNIIYS